MPEKCSWKKWVFNFRVQRHFGLALCLLLNLLCAHRKQSHSFHWSLDCFNNQVPFWNKKIQCNWLRTYGQFDRPLNPMPPDAQKELSLHKWDIRTGQVRRRGGGTKFTYCRVFSRINSLKWVRVKYCHLRFVLATDQLTDSG